MSKLSLFHLNVVSNYIMDKNNYVNLMQVSKKCQELPNYLNQFNAYPSFENRQLFKQKYKPHKFNFNMVNEYYDGTISTEIIKNQPIKTMYLHINPKIMKIYRDLDTGSHECWDLIYDFAEMFFNYHYGKDPSTKKAYVHKLYVSKYIAEFNFRNHDQGFLKYINAKNIVIPYGVTKIGNGAFTRGYGLTNIKIPNTVKEIGSYAFFNCSNLRSIRIPSSVTKLGNFCFAHCYKLSSVKLPNSLIGIGNKAFFGRISLNKLVIPTSVQNIGIDIISPIYVLPQRIELINIKLIKFIIPIKFKKHILFSDGSQLTYFTKNNDYIIYY